MKPKRKRGRKRSNAHQDAADAMAKEPRQSRRRETKAEIVFNGLRARAIRTGIAKPKDLAAPWMGCEVGRSLAIWKDVAQLWQTVCLIRAKHRAYLAALNGPLMFPKTARIPVAPSKEPGLERPDYDLRTDEEKAHAAIAAWDDFCATLRAVDPCLPQYVVRTVVQDEPGRDLARVLRWIAEKA